MYIRKVKSCRHCPFMRMHKEFGIRGWEYRCYAKKGSNGRLISRDPPGLRMANWCPLPIKVEVHRAT